MKKTTTALVAFLALTSCSSPRDSLPEIAKIYENAALHEARNPVVVIHGILGARLARANDMMQPVWGAFTGDYADPQTRDGARAIAVHIDGTPSDVRATGPLQALKLSFLFNVISVDVYRQIIQTLGAGGYTDNVALDPNSPRYAEDHFTCYSFWYDWRQDNVANARALGAYLQETRKEIVRRAEAKIARLRGNATLANAAEADELEGWLARGFRFDIVAHSMGGLVARYFLRYGATDLPEDGTVPEVTWAGAKEIDRLIMVGTPNLGSMGALDQLTNGYQPAVILPFYDQAVLGTMPSIYQLLPRRRHNLVLDQRGGRLDVDFMDPKVWEENRWGLLDPSVAETLAWLLPDAATRDAKAREHLRWCLQRAETFHRAMDKKPERDCPAEIYLFAADSQRTLARTIMKNKDGRLVPTFPVDDRTTVPGDVTVPRYSAVGDEREGNPFRWGVQTAIPFKNRTFLSDDHVGLTKNPHFSNNMLHILLEHAPPRR